MGGGHPGLCGSGVSIPALRMGGGQLEVCLGPLLPSDPATKTGQVQLGIAIPKMGERIRGLGPSSASLGYMNPYLENKTNPLNNNSD